ncbi:glycosyltransferase family 2 protein [Thiomicrorhabdus sp. zzn3]|uniref:glycosyltransferase family 2 protein n=1 Tax=Thiomicrorhabdus sp. zzn3 TaxID=3039775 RepID=UPI00243667F2|nr:glycosyltransferase family 2 protein [Thiomicrorhabdus sp. zzn3]MDG6777383.1 glycosyltransferase family 2 protein [Thiomicrorhabdus sp. zzn3]
MIVIPMAGLSSRFYKAGYTVPKYELPLGDRTVFDHAVLSFKRYFEDEMFCFVTRKHLDAKNFIENSLSDLGVKSFKVVELESETLGQADTVYQVVKDMADESLIIFNIDTFIQDYIKPSWLGDCDGYLEVFHEEGEHWSFAVPGPENTVLKTAEKERLSDLCSDGLYYFKSSKEYTNLVREAIDSKSFVKGELYIAPLYNRLISKGKIVKYELVKRDRITLCGTPEEYKRVKSILG